MGRPSRWSTTLAAARDEAVLAVRLYNDPSEPRAFEGFVVHMHVAWLYLLHAKFMRDGFDIRYPDPMNARRYVRVDGEHKRWDLARCCEEQWPDSHDPIRMNLEFFIALRNRIEHRHDRAQRRLAEAVSGHSQALLLNFERELTSQFGDDRSLATILRFPVFVGTFTTAGVEALRTLRRRLPSGLQNFIADYHSGLPDSVTGNDRFELRLNVVLQQTHTSDSPAIQFSRWDDMSDDEKQAAMLLGRHGRAIVREQKRSIVGHGLLKPKEVQRRVAADIPFRFNSYDFLCAWKRKKIRPPTGAPQPERTDERYCLYIELTRSYGYTEAWVKWLIRNCGDAAGFKRVTGRDPAGKE